MNGERPNTEARLESTNEHELAAALSAFTGCAVRVRYSRSRSSAIACERLRHVDDDGVVRVAFDLRLAAFFDAAPPTVVEDLASWLVHGKRRRTAHERLMAWIDARWKELPPRAIPRWGRRTAGEAHDLAACLARVRERDDLGALRALDPWPAVGWGRWPTRAPKRGLQLGSYDGERNWVRIHPVLDADDVPASFVEFVIAHECLHALVAQQGWDEGAHHGPRFRALERAFDGFAEANAWQAANTNRLVRRVRARFARR